MFYLIRLVFSFIIFLNDHGDETHIIGWYFRFHHFLSVWIFFVVINIVLISPPPLSLSLSLSIFCPDFAITPCNRIYRIVFHWKPFGVMHDDVNILYSQAYKKQCAASFLECTEPV